MHLQTITKIFSLTNPAKAWAVLNIFSENENLVKVGSAVKIIPQVAPQKAFSAHINFVEPFYRQGSKTVTARVYFDNSALQLPIGSQLRATISGNIINADWLPQETVLSLGLNQIVFVKSDGGFRAKKIQTGIKQNNMVQVTNGLTITDTIASNAQYLFDSESFIKVNQ